MRNEVREVLAGIYEAMHRRRAILLTLSAIVVFITTYVLILPAFTLEKDEALKQGGIDVSGVETVEVADEQAEEAVTSSDETAETKEDQSGDVQKKEDPDSTEKADKGDKKEAGKSEKAVKKNGKDDLKFEAEKYSIELTDGNSILPEDTELIVEEIGPESDRKDYDNLYKEAIEAIRKEEGKVKAAAFTSAKFYDISLINGNEKVEPEDLVNVKITYDEAVPVAGESKVRIVHFAEDAETGVTTAEVLDEKDVDVTVEDKTLTETSFDADSFSVYAVVYEELNTKVLSADGKTYTIKVKYDARAEIPAGAELKAKEVKTGSDEYKEYLADTAMTFSTAQQDISFARFFDIEITKNGEKIEPKVPVQVSIEYDEAPEITDDSKLSVIHFADEGTEVIDDIAVQKEGKEFVYEQDSFSVTGTIISNPQAGGKPGHRYAVLVKNGDQYYLVENEGQLVPVTTSTDSTGRITVDLPYPTMWTYVSGHDGIQNDGEHDYDEHGNDSPPNNLRIGYNARRFDPGTQLPLGTYFRYISPHSETGIEQEDEEHPSHDDYKGRNLLWYDENTHTIEGRRNWNNDDRTGQYIGADFDAMHITGQQPVQNAAEIYFAEITAIPNVSSNNETVSHIDIGIIGEGALDIPLAYGKYYYDSNQTEEAPFGEVSQTNNVTLHLEQNIDVTKEDIMRADLRSYDKNGNELNNAFYVTGYTANEHTDHSAVQVRIDGSFKVSTLDPYQAEWWDGNAANNDPERRQQRLDNQVYYRITTQKEVTFDLVYTDDNGNKHQLYDASGNKLSVTTICNLNAGFSYWDENNECPPVLEDWEIKYPWLSRDHEPGYNNSWWKQGVIVDNGSIYGGDSGMDFVIGNKQNPDEKIVAVEIVKMIVDENGNRIRPANRITNNFDIYYSKDKAGLTQIRDFAVDAPTSEEDLAANGILIGYNRLRSTDIVVGSDGIGSVYDYQVDPGTFYVKEDPAPMGENGANKVIQDVDGEEWTYVTTRVETEYVWRNNANDGKRHMADGYTGVPEVLGDYSYDAPNPQEDGATEGWNTFLEFYVYNVYAHKKYPIDLKKVDTADRTKTLAGAEFDLYGPYEEERASDTDAPDTGRKETKWNTSSITTGADGTVHVGDLEEGIYYLYETKAPTGFVLMEEPIVITVDPSKSDEQAVRYEQTGNSQSDWAYNSTTKTYELVVTNSAGAELPHTGGVGTTVIYIAGALLVIGSGILLVRRRKMTRQ